MQFRTLIAPFFCVLLAAAPIRPDVPVASTSGLSPAMEAQLVAAARHELSAYGGKTPVPGVFIGVWVKNQVRFVRSIGYADLSPQRPFALDDRFRVGSNTKTFVVTVLLQLVDEGKLKLDDKLSKFNVGATFPNADKITIRELCEMRSGIIDAYNTPQMDKIDLTPTTKLSQHQLLVWAAANPPLFAPGTKYNYSNTNYLLLGDIIEHITHDTIAHQIQTRLLSRYGLSATTYPTTPDMPAPYAHGYGLSKNGRWDDVSVQIPPGIVGAAGAMISTVPDMQRWVKLYVTGATNSKATQRERLTCVPTSPGVSAGVSGFGLGIGCSNGWYGYTGGIPGYNTAAFYSPAEDATIVAFVTAQQESPKPGVANSVVRDITKILFPSHVMSGG